MPEVERLQAEGKRVAFRADAAFTKPEIYQALEQRGVQYAIRIPANESLEWNIADLLFRPPGRPGRKPLVRYSVLSIKRAVGPNRDESWRKSSTMLASCSRASALS